MLYDEFELKIPRCFRDDRQSFLDQMDYKIDEILKKLKNNDVRVEIDETREIKSSVSQLNTMESSKSHFNVDILTNDEKKMPQTAQEIMNEKIFRDSDMKSVEKATRDKIFVHECLYNIYTGNSIHLELFVLNLIFYVFHKLAFFFELKNQIEYL